MRKDLSRFDKKTEFKWFDGDFAERVFQFTCYAVVAIALVAFASAIYGFFGLPPLGGGV